MFAEPQDWFGAWITPTRIGAWSFAVVGLPDAWGGWARDLLIRFQAGIDISLDLADGAAMADARSMLPGISKADRRATATLAMKLAAPTPVETRMELANSGQRHGPHAADRGSQPRKHRRPVQALGRPRGGRVLGLVRDVPALRGSRPTEERDAPHGSASPPCHRGDGLQRRLSAADPSDRHHASQRPEQHHRMRPRRPREPVGHRVRRRRPYQRASRPGHDRGFRRLRRRSRDVEPRGGARLRPQLQPGPPVGHGTPAVVQASFRRLDPVRGEPAEALPGHLPTRLRHRRLPCGSGRRSPT